MCIQYCLEAGKEWLSFERCYNQVWNNFDCCHYSSDIRGCSATYLVILCRTDFHSLCISRLEKWIYFSFSKTQIFIFICPCIFCVHPVSNHPFTTLCPEIFQPGLLRCFIAVVTSPGSTPDPPFPELSAPCITGLVALSAEPVFVFFTFEKPAEFIFKNNTAGHDIVNCGPAGSILWFDSGPDSIAWRVVGGSYYRRTWEFPGHIYQSKSFCRVSGNGLALGVEHDFYYGIPMAAGHSFAGLYTKPF